MSKTKVIKYKGDKALQSGIRSMARKGYVVQSRTARKQMWSWMTGIFTRKQIHTVIFTKEVQS